MVRSMTGFGRAERITDTEKITVEIKSVNHRYLDVAVKLPRRMNAFDPLIRKEIKNFVKRGKVDIFVAYEQFGGDDAKLVFNHKIAQEYIACGLKMAEEFHIEPIRSAAELAELPDVFTLTGDELDEDRIWDLVKSTLHMAGADFEAHRGIEGEHLRDDILMKLDEMYDDVIRVEERAPEIVEEYRSRLYAKVKETIEGNVDEARLVSEIVIYADKVCVDEETVRLKSHIQSMRSAFESLDPDGIGRRLDFIAQEMNREANTILSKTGKIDISETAIRIKTGIEKIREQVQNIE